MFSPQLMINEDYNYTTTMPCHVIHALSLYKISSIQKFMYNETVVGFNIMSFSLVVIKKSKQQYFLSYVRYFYIV